MKKIMIIVAGLLFSSVATAVQDWYKGSDKQLTSWKLSLSNGVAYIETAEVASHCANDRLLIDVSGTEFDKALYAYVLSAKARGKSLEYVTDDTIAECKVYGLKEID